LTNSQYYSNIINQYDNIEYTLKGGYKKMEEKEVLLTQEGYNNLEKELDILRTEKRAEIAERIKVALGFGDLSENSEYDEAKTAQAENELKIAELENKLRHAKIIDESEIDTKRVQVGNKVRVLDLEYNDEIEYTIVGSTEVDLSQNRISNESPVGAALLGAKKNQEVEIPVPAGVVKYKVLSIAK
jgi:transcription elongation factor GreA